MRSHEFNEGVLHEQIAMFREQNPHARVWAEDIVHGHEEEEPDDLPACEGMSRAFRDHLRAHGVHDPHVVQADQAEHEWADYHQFTRVPHPEGDFNIDWTARQFRNLDNPVKPEHYEQTEQVPLVWRGRAHQHPVSDLKFRRERRVDEDDPKRWVLE